MDGVKESCTELLTELLVKVDEGKVGAFVVVYENERGGYTTLQSSCEHASAMGAQLIRAGLVRLGVSVEE